MTCDVSGNLTVTADLFTGGTGIYSQIKLNGGNYIDLNGANFYTWLNVGAGTNQVFLKDSAGSVGIVGSSVICPTPTPTPSPTPTHTPTATPTPTPTSTPIPTPTPTQVLYPFTLAFVQGQFSDRFGPAACLRYAAGLTSVYYSDCSVLADTCHLYLDAAGTPLTQLGWFSNGSTYWVIDSSYGLRAHASCPTPTPTPTTSPTATPTPTATPVPFTGTVYFATTFSGACPYGSGLSGIVTGDGTTFCNSQYFTGNTFAYQTSGTYYLNYNGNVVTIALTHGSNVADVMSSCSVCPTPTPTPTTSPTPTPTPTPTTSPTPTPTATPIPTPTPSPTPSPSPTPFGAGYYDCGYGCTYYDHNPGCDACSIGNTYNFYLMDEYVCPYNTIAASNVIVAFPAGSTPTLNSYYRDLGGQGYVYRYKGSSLQSGQPASLVSSTAYTTLTAACNSSV
jgi:hypothetical protein